MSRPAALSMTRGGVWQCGAHALDTTHPLIMGIVNTTPDSFSDGGSYATADAAVERGMALLEAGADIIDIGGESTRPGAEPVSHDEEKRRILEPIERLAAAGAIVSVDTMHVPVMRAALSHGASIINDVNGFRAEGAMELAASSDCGLVVMHMHGEPRTMQREPAYADVVGEVSAFLHRRVEQLMAAGVARERLCVDPGIGFGKTREHNVALINHLHDLVPGFPLLAGISRKSIFKHLCVEANERDTISAIAGALLLERGATILRVHNVALTTQAVATWRLLAPMNGENVQVLP